MRIDPAHCTSGSTITAAISSARAASVASICANMRRLCASQFSPGSRRWQSGEGTVITSISSGWYTFLYSSTSPTASAPSVSPW